MRILQVVHGFAPECRGGTESYVLEATIALRAAGHQVSVLAGSLEPREPAQLAEDEVEGIPVTRLHRSGLFVDDWEKSFDTDAGALYGALLDKLRPDVVHVHHWIRLTRNLVEIAASRGIPAVVTLHDAAASCPRVFRVREEAFCERSLSIASCLDCVPRPAWMDDAECGGEIEAYARDFAQELRLASAVVVPSQAHQQLMQRQLGLPASSFRVVPHGRLQRDRPRRAPRGPRGGRLILGHWGHLEPYKGYHVILEALRLLTEAERGRVELICFGVASDPSYRKRLDALSGGMPVTERGRFSPRDLESAPLDLAVIPSLASESYSFVLDEAFELGIPVLVSARGALVERLGGAGATFEPGSPEALAARIREVLADTGILARWQAAIPDLSSMRAHAARLGRIYAGAVRHRKGPSPPDPAVADARLASLARRLEARTRALEDAMAIARGRGEALRSKDQDIAGFRTSAETHERLAKERQEAIAAKDAVLAEFQRSVAEHKAALERREEHVRALEASAADLRIALDGLGKELAATSAERAEAERAWARAIDDYRESVARHGEALREARSAEAAASARATALSAALDDAERRAREAVAGARAVEDEAAGLQAAMAAAAAERARAVAAARALDAGRAEDQREAAGWRARALKAEASVTGGEEALRATMRALEAARARIEEQTRRTEALEDEARRAGDLARRGAESLALPLRMGESGVVAATADLVSAVLEQQTRLGELREWARSLDGARGAAELSQKLDALPRRLRILMVIHDFLPYHAAGSELYTYQLSKALSARHDVELVFCENRPERPEYETRRDAYDGIPFTEIVHHSAFPDFRSRYMDPVMEARFDEVLDRFRPDVVHVQHTKFFGVGILGRAARRGIPVVYTLHEYMLLCARDGQMLRADGVRCERPEVGACATCMAGELVEPGALARVARHAGRLLGKVLPGPLKSVGARVARRAAVRHGAAVPADRRPRLVGERQRAIRSALGAVDLFLAPSEFLRRTFIDSGFAKPERIVVSRYGQDLTRFQDRGPRSPGPLRVGYLGTIAAYKGVQVLVDALNKLAPYDVEGRIHGVTEFFPDFVAQLEARITNPRVRILGRYQNSEVGRILAGMDVLVVPSLWWENSPITIHEAFLAGVPVVASDQGGMAELVQDGVNGFVFRIGDAADLARVLMRFVADPGLVETLRPRREIVRDIREDALWTEGQYRRLLAEKASRG